MSKESYIRGFCKAAEAAGVDPEGLAKFAQQVFPGMRPGPTVANGIMEAGKDVASKISPAQTGGLVGSGFLQNMAHGNFPTFKATHGVASRPYGETNKTVAMLSPPSGPQAVEKNPMFSDYRGKNPLSYKDRIIGAVKGGIRGSQKGPFGLFADRMMRRGR